MAVLITVDRDFAGDPWCHDCPLWCGEWATCSVFDFEALECPNDTHRNTDGTDSYDEGAPDWCPLRRGGVVVT